MIECPNCNKENSHTNVFCIYCGYRISPEGTEKDEIAGIRRILADLNQRVNALEANKISDIGEPNSLAGQVPHTEGFSGIAPSNEPTDKLKVGSSSGNIFSSYFKKYLQGDLESIIGRNWFAILGVTALSIGIAFFLLLAFENNWVNDFGRAIIGMVVGALLIFLGDYVRDRYSIWSRAVVGGGLAILLITVYVAFDSYQLLPYWGALVLLCAVSLMGAFLALRHNARLTAILSVAIAFVNPVLIDFADFQNLILYIAIVNLSVLVIAFLKNWRMLTSVAIAGSYFYMFSIVASVYSDNMQFPLSEIMILQSGFTIIFLIFVGATTFFHIYSKKSPVYPDLSLMIINAVAYYVLSVAFLDAQQLGRNYVQNLGWILGSLYLIIGYISYKVALVSPRVPLFSAGIAILFFTVSIPIQFGGEWVSVAWGAEGLLLVVSGLLLRNWRARSLGLVLIGVASLRLLQIPDLDLSNNSQNFLSLRDDVLVASILLIIISYVASYVLYLNRNFELEEDVMASQNNIWPARWWLMVLSTILTIWLIATETVAYFRQMAFSTDQLFLGQFPDVAGTLIVTVFLALYSVITFMIALRMKSVVMWYIFLGVGLLTLSKLVIIDYTNFVVIPFKFIAIYNLYFVLKILSISLLLLVTILAKSWYPPRIQYPTLNKSLWGIFNALVVFSFTTELISFFESRVYVSSLDTMSAMHLSLTLLWALHAVVILMYGFFSKNRALRMIGLLFLVIPIGKLFILDVFLLDSGYRVAAFVVLGITMLSIGFGYQKYNHLFRGIFFSANK